MTPIVAIDPGTHESAKLVWNGEHPALAEILDNAALLDWVKIICRCNRQTHVYCEMIASYGKAVGSEIFQTCLLVGRIQQICADSGNPFTLIYRKDVKMHLCGTMRAKDSNIRQALIDRFGVVGTKKNPGPLFGISSHLWAALAVAVYAGDKSGNTEIRQAGPA